MVKRNGGFMRKHPLVCITVFLLFPSLMSIGLSSHADSLKQKDKAPQFPDKTVRLNISKSEPGEYTVNVGELQEDIDVDKKRREDNPGDLLGGSDSGCSRVGDHVLCLSSTRALALRK